MFETLKSKLGGKPAINTEVREIQNGIFDALKNKKKGTSMFQKAFPQVAVGTLKIDARGNTRRREAIYNAAYEDVTKELKEFVQYLEYYDFAAGVSAAAADMRGPYRSTVNKDAKPYQVESFALGVFLFMAPGELRD